jgi:hypothetical protein
MAATEQRNIIDEIVEDHREVEEYPPANKILDPGVGLIDRMRDALTGRNT